MLIDIDEEAICASLASMDAGEGSYVVLITRIFGLFVICEYERKYLSYSEPIEKSSCG